MSMGAKIGIGVAVPIGVIGLGLVSFFFWRARKKDRRESGTSYGAVSAQHGHPQPPMGPVMAQHTGPHGHHPGSISAASGHQSVGTSNISPPSHVSSNQPMLYGGAGAAGLAAGAGATHSWHQPSHTNSYHGSSTASPAHEISAMNQPHEMAGVDRYHSPGLATSPPISQYGDNGSVHQPTPQYPQNTQQYSQPSYGYPQQQAPGYGHPGQQYQPYRG